MQFNKIEILFVCLFVIIVSCSGLNKYYSKLETFMTKGDYQQAHSLIDISKEDYGPKNELLYYLDLGLLEHISKNYQKSNESFEQAKKIYDKNYTKSISQATISIFSNDNVITYYGNDYEMAYANVFCALNYILLGKDNEAVVEARQVDNLFKKIKVDTKGKAFYNDDGFVRYFMGIVYENAGYYNDALISYKIALEDYLNKQNNSYVPVPQDLLNRLYSMYNKLSMYKEADLFKEKYTINSVPLKDNEGELVVVNYNGLSPKKIDYIFAISLFKGLPYFMSVAEKDPEQKKVAEVNSAIVAGLADDFIKIAIPKYVKYSNEIVSFCVEDITEVAKEKNINISTMVCDIGSLMVSVLESNKTAIYTKTIARAVGRYVLAKVASEQVKQHNKDLAVFVNMALNITNSLLEKADKRSWVTLPETINMLSMNLSSGVHTLNINFLNSRREIVTTKQIEVNIEPNKLNFVVINSFKHVKK